MAENFCKNLLSMTEWTHGKKKGKSCPSCVIGIATQWYVSELEENGQLQQARMLAEKVKSGLSAKEIGMCLDKIKQEVPVILKERLLEFDCSVQSS